MDLSNFDIFLDGYPTNRVVINCESKEEAIEAFKVFHEGTGTIDAVKSQTPYFYGNGSRGKIKACIFEKTTRRPIKKSEVARNVRVYLNDKFEEKCLGDKYLKDETFLFLRDGHVYNDTKGDYVFIAGGSGTNGGYAYLNQLDVEVFPVMDL